MTRRPPILGLVHNFTPDISPSPCDVASDPPFLLPQTGTWTGACVFGYGPRGYHATVSPHVLLTRVLPREISDPELAALLPFHPGARDQSSEPQSPAEIAQLPFAIRPTASRHRPGPGQKRPAAPPARPSRCGNITPDAKCPEYLRRHWRLATSPRPGGSGSVESLAPLHTSLGSLETRALPRLTIAHSAAGAQRRQGGWGGGRAAGASLAPWEGQLSAPRSPPGRAIRPVAVCSQA